MQNPNTPGVKIEEVLSGTQPITAAGSSTAAFIGKTNSTFTSVKDTPIRISSWGEYVANFGEIEDKDPNPDLMGHSVYGFFANGGAVAYVVNISSKSQLNVDAVIGKIEAIDEIGMIILPDDPLNTGTPLLLNEAVTHASNMGDRMVLLSPKKSVKLVGAQTEPSSNREFTALYYPWIEVSNPHFHPQDNPTVKPAFFVPPAGHVAGIWSRIDATRGVWKSPAGLAASIAGVLRTEFTVTDTLQNDLNPQGINCIRTIANTTVVWGARTLDTTTFDNKYIAIRRTMMMVKESIRDGIQWAVFEPNNHNLWASLRLNIETFMGGLHRAGAFQGEKSSDAFFVRCGKGQTMTQADIDAGQVIVEVGFAPLKPAEFVIVRLSQATKN